MQEVPKKKPLISLIVAMDEERGIGKDNHLPWHVPEDLKRFKALTMGHPIIMGRKTHESIGRALPGRTNIVITRDELYRATGCVICYTLEGAIEYAGQEGTEEIFIIGGAKVFAQAIDLADKLYVTLVKGTHGADTFFPAYDEFRQVLREEHKQDEMYQYTFVDLARP